MWYQESQFKKYLFIALAFVVANFFLWGGQEYIFRKEHRQIKILKTELESQKIELDRAKKTILSEDKGLVQLKGLLAQYEKLGQFDMYNRSVDKYNSLLKTYQSDIAKFNQGIKNYNSKVEVINSLNEIVGGKYYIVPIPIGRTHSVSRYRE